MNRREFLFSGAASALSAAPAPPLLMISGEDAERMKNAAAGSAGLRGLVDSALKAGPWSVAWRRPPSGRTAAGRNDYYSEAPYWWPDPKNPNGPFIRKDGERFPDRFTGNRTDLAEMSETVLALGIGARLLGDGRCPMRAARVLSVWFSDPDTRMKPHLEYGQAVRGRSTGRGAGMIETVSLIYAAQGIALLDAAGLDPEVSRAVRRWFTDYLNWATTSANGLSEKKAGNNHGTWWTAQTAAFASLTADAAARRMAWQHYREHLVPGQVEPDGSCPREEARTRSLSYSAMNLDGFSVLCRLAQMDGVDLWRYRTPKGTSVEKSLYYLLPYVADPAKWKKQQITGFDQDRTVFPGLAGLGLQSRELLSVYRKLPRAATAWVLFVDLLVRSSA